MTVVKHRRRKMQSSCRHWNRGLPALRALGAALLQERLDAFELHAGDDRSYVDGLIERRTDAQCVHAVLNLADQLLRDAFLHQQARTGTANLPLVEPDAVDETFHCAVEIRVLKNDERGLATKFEREFFVTLRRRSSNRAPDFGRTRESDFVDVGMVYQRLAG